MFLLDKIENGIEISDVVTRKREPQADFLADSFAVAESSDGFVERADFAAEVIMCGTHAIERNADIGEADVLDALGPLGIDQCAVGRKGEAQALAGGVFGQFKEMRVYCRFTTRKQERGHLELGEIVHHCLALLPIEFAGVEFRIRVLITMDAFQVAAPGNVPDDDGTTFSGGGGRAVATAVTQVIQWLRDIAIKAGEVDHDLVSTHGGHCVAPPILRNA